jgi:hypothetical protein
MSFQPIDRRSVLKGLGVSIALPMLESMMPGLAFTATNAPRVTAPRRMAFVYVPNGVNMAEWTPRGLGPNFELPRTLQPLQSLRQDLLVMSGLTCDKARPNGDGAGDHARAMSAFLTGCQARKTAGTDIRVGISADQVAAQRLGNVTRFPSLEIGCEGGRLAGNCDSGYSCAYSSNLSWRSETTPNPKETNPRQVFDRLFGSRNTQESAQAQARREQYNLSILDFVMEDADNLMGRVGTSDRRRLDEYLTSIREIETRLTRADGATGPGPGMARPSGTPRDYPQHITLMSDLLALAFQGDLTRVATFVFANEGSNRSYRHIQVSEGHHDLSHHQGNREKLEKLAQINQFHITQYAHLLNRLKSIREGNGTLLDNCMILYGSGNGDGNRHNHDELPVLLAGRGGNTITTGRHLRFPRETPLTNLFLSMLDRMGVSVPSIGDSTGRLQNLG